MRARIATVSHLKITTGGTRTEFGQGGAGPSEANVFWAHAPLQGACENLAVTNVQADGDNLVDTIFEGLQEQSRRKITNESRRYICNFPERVRPRRRARTHSLTLGSGEAGMLRVFINTTNNVEASSPKLQGRVHADKPACTYSMDGGVSSVASGCGGVSSVASA